MGVIEGIYYGSPHSVNPPAEDVSAVALMIEHFYAFGIVNLAFKSTQRFSVTQRLFLSAVLTVGSCGLVRSLKSDWNKKAHMIVRQIPTAIAAIGAFHVSGVFGMSILSTIPWNAAHDLELVPEAIEPLSKACRLSVVYFGSLVYGIAIEKVIVVARFVLLPFGNQSQNMKLVGGSLMEAIGAAREMVY